MSLPDLVNEGFRLYRKPEQLAVDCAEMRILEDHLWHLSEICEEFSVLSMHSPLLDGERIPREWPRVVRWLRMAAGLTYVDLDFGYGETDPTLCGIAADFQEAASDAVSAFATELTRLHYVWNATERMLEVLRLPAVPETSARYNRATALLGEYWDCQDLPEHYECILAHLRSHIERDSWLSEEARLKQSLEERPWRSRSGMLLDAANQFRHLPAHGGMDLPEPSRWGPEEPSGGKQVALTGPRS